MEHGRTNAAGSYETLVELLQMRAQCESPFYGYTFLSDGDTGERQMSYDELARRAQTIGALLQSQGAKGQRVLLLYPPGLEYIEAFFGCLYAGAIVVPAYPPHPRRPMPRLQAIVADSRAAFALTSSSILTEMQQRLTHLPDLAALRWLTSDALPSELALQWRDPQVGSETLAFLQYTSGSVGLPKGVMLTHANLLANSALISRHFGSSSANIGVSWLPPYHDMGLIGGILQPLYAGFPVTLMSPAYFLQQPLRWLQAISTRRATASGGPNFAYDLCARTTTDAQKAELDLSCWELAFNGAEPVRAETLERFAAAFACCGFRREALYPCYGLAEATLLVSGSVKGRSPLVGTFSAAALEQHQGINAATDDKTETRTLVGYRNDDSGQSVRIVHPQTCQPCAPSEVGEIWVEGPSVAQGYWMRPEESTATFQGRLANSDTGRFLRTGDLGFMHEDALFVTGRLKDLIIIRGRNHYPQDIELTVEQCHHALRPACGAAFSVEIEGSERLIIVYEVERQHRSVDSEEVAQRVRQAVAEQHELQVYAVLLVRPGGIPKTSSGKIQRHACRAQYLEDTLPLVGKSILVADNHEEQATTLTREQFCALPPEERPQAVLATLQTLAATAFALPTHLLYPHQPLTTLGLDSLMALEFKCSIESSLSIQLPMASLFQQGTLAQLTEQVLELLESAPIREANQRSPEHLDQLAATLQEEDAPFPLTPGQQALWFLQQLEPDNTAYTIAQAASFHGPLDHAALQRAFQRLVDRHPALRTTFVEQEEGKCLQSAHTQQEVYFQIEDGSTLSEEGLRAKLSEYAARPFDLQQGPLLRIHLFIRSPEEHVLLLTIHHLIADLWSLALLIEELRRFYTAEKSGEQLALPELDWHYRSYVHWQQEMLSGARGEQLRSFWQEYLRGELPVLNLPFDHQRPAMQSYRGASHPFVFDELMTRRLEELARAQGVTLYTLLLAAFQVLLHRYTGQQDILVGSPTSGRGQAEVAGMVGYFVHPVVQRAQVESTLSFSAFLQQAKGRVQEALAHQDYPFPLLVEQLAPERDASRTPLFQVMFALQKTHRLKELAAFVLAETTTSLQLADLLIHPFPLEQRTARFDLTLEMVAGETVLPGRLEYNSDLFESATIERLAQSWQQILAAILEDPERAIYKLTIMSQAEETLLEELGSGVTLADEQAQCLHQIFEAQARRTPDAIAINDGRESLTYAQVNQHANQLAHRLHNSGIGPEMLVGICLPRTNALLVSILAVLKAGGAYVPLDQTYPAERLAFILEQAQIQIVLTQHPFPTLFTEQSIPCVAVDDSMWAPAETRNEPPISKAQSANLAYVIYTSGSTGRPKGVAITHASAVTLIHWAQRLYEPAELAFTLASTSVCFDLSIYELFVPLSCGGCVVLVENALSLLEQKVRSAITLVNTVPSALAELLRQRGIPETVRVINVAGEPLPGELVQAAYQQTAVQRIFNLYGPSEDTTYSTYALMNAYDEQVPPIGGPIASTQVYILDAQLQRMPRGVVGEIYLGGAGLARGYLRQPALTAERFIPHPFSLKGGERLYKSGDLGRYREDGQIEFLGRCDNQVKLHGYRIEPGEIEATLARHSSLRRVLVQLHEDARGEKRLVAYAEVREDQTPTADDLRLFLQAYIPEYMIPAAFVLLQAWPLSPNGKIDRRALPAPFWDVSPANRVAPRTATEERLIHIWSEVLGIEQQHIGIYNNFFELGGHSLLAVQLQARIQSAFQTSLSLQVVFQQATIAGLAQWLDTSIQASTLASTIQPRTRHDSIPVSFSQLRLWMLYQLQPDNSAYNMPGVVRLTGKLDVDALERSINAVVQRHESLRTTFVAADTPEQLILPHVAIPISLHDLREEPLSRREEVLDRYVQERARRPFDLVHGPVLRVELLRLQDEEHMLLLVVHHIVADGWSLAILVREIAAFYNASVRKSKPSLSSLPIQYADYTLWQRDQPQEESMAQQLTYWRRQLSGTLPSLVSELPYDAPPLQDQGQASARLVGRVNCTTTAALKTLSLRQGVTLFMTLLGAFQMLLYRLSGQEDVIVGTPVAGRTMSELESLIGCFVNTLALRTNLAGGPSFQQLLARVREVVLGAQDHQMLPFEKLLEVLQPERLLDHSPVFDVMLNFNNTPPLALTLAGLDLTLLNNVELESKFALTLYVEEQHDELHLQLVYQRTRFSSERIACLLDQYLYLLQQCVEDASRSIDDYTLITPTSQLLLPDPQEPLVEVSYPLIHQMVEACAARLPEQAVICQVDQCKSYGQLMQQANQLGRILIARGVKPGEVVAVSGAASFGLIASALAIFISGGVFLLLDEQIPLQRQQLMCEEAHVCHAMVIGARPWSLALNLESEPLSIEQTEATPLHEDRLSADWETVSLPAIAPDDAAYIFFTSGTTGVPKGVLGSHKGMAHFLAWQRETFTVGPTDRAAQLTRLSFDVVLRDIFLPLTSGATLCLPEPDAILRPDTLLPWLRQERITLLHTVPTLAQSWLNALQAPYLLPELRLVFFAGEPLKSVLLQRWRQTFGPMATLVNLYGPTETTLAKLFYIIPALADPGVQRLGRPMPGAQAFVLRENGQCAGLGEAGEIVIRTPYRSHGYINANAEQVQRFRQNPFRSDDHDLLYFTGDRGRYTLDGQLEILGRQDDQVKIRGVRVELREIELALLELPAIREAIVLAREDSFSHETYLASFVVLEHGQQFTPALLRGALRERLPQYMLPAAIVVLERLPMGTNGKVDKGQLPAIDASAFWQEEAPVAPHTPIEQELAAIWCEVLHREQIGVHHNFFDLGGHSLLAAQVIARVQNAFGIELRLRDMFTTPTIAGIAALVEDALVETASAEELDDLLALLEN